MFIAILRRLSDGAMRLGNGDEMNMEAELDISYLTAFFQLVLEDVPFKVVLFREGADARYFDVVIEAPGHKVKLNVMYRAKHFEQKFIFDGVYRDLDAENLFKFLWKDAINANSSDSH